jgi:hypothetical protein
LRASTYSRIVVTVSGRGGRSSADAARQRVGAGQERGRGTAVPGSGTQGGGGSVAGTAAGGTSGCAGSPVPGSGHHAGGSTSAAPATRPPRVAPPAPTPPAPSGGRGRGPGPGTAPSAHPTREHGERSTAAPTNPPRPPPSPNGPPATLDNSTERTPKTGPGTAHTGRAAIPCRQRRTRRVDEEGTPTGVARSMVVTRSPRASLGKPYFTLSNSHAPRAPHGPADSWRLTYALSTVTRAAPSLSPSRAGTGVPIFPTLSHLSHRQEKPPGFIRGEGSHRRWDR